LSQAPLFSIIVPAWNRAGTLSACLPSLLHLEYPRGRFEAIVVDDGSQPPIEMPDGFPIRLVRSPENEGPAAARNRGASHARGTFLAFIDNDCAPGPDWLRRLEHCCAATPQAVLGGRIVDGLPRNPYSAASAAIADAVYRYYNSDRLNARFLASANIAMAADVFRGLGGFNTAFRTSEDREFCARCTQNGVQLVYDPDAAVVHIHPVGFRAFWQRHYRYGQGAFRFWRARASYEPAAALPEPPGFYWKILLSAFAGRRNLRAVLLTVLIAISQLASAAGLFSAWRRPRAATGS
jgi:glycosyltransferase involved in cell wall biosynthesis